MAVEQGHQWLADPGGRHQFRLYTDGRPTDWVTDGSSVTEDPLPALADPAPAGLPPSGYDVPGAPSREPAGTPTPASPEPGPTSTPPRPAGWYRNATDPDEIRYWDGARWAWDRNGAPLPSERPEPAPVEQATIAPTAPAGGAYGQADRASYELRIRTVPAEGQTSVGTADATPAPAEPSPSAVPADWYPDPSDRTRLRYWDGMGWTAHVLDQVPTPLGSPPGGGGGSASGPGHHPV